MALPEIVKRSQYATFLNVGTAEAPDYVLFGDGIADMSETLNPQTETKTWVTQDSGTTDITSYQGSLPFDAEHIKSDEAIAFLDAMRNQGPPVLDAAIADIVHVRKYETPVGDEYPATKRVVTVAFESYGGPGGAAARLAGTLHYRGDPVQGTFDPTEATFTPTEESA